MKGEHAVVRRRSSVDVTRVWVSHPNLRLRDTGGLKRRVKPGLINSRRDCRCLGAGFSTTYGITIGGKEIRKKRILCLTIIITTILHIVDE